MNAEAAKQLADQQRRAEEFDREMRDIARERRGADRLPEFRDPPQLTMAERYGRAA